MEKINDLMSLRLRSVELAFRYFSGNAPFEIAKQIESHVKEGIELENIKDDTNKFIELATSMCNKNLNNDVELSKLPKFALDVKIKKLSENAVIPAYAHATDAGLDLVATSYEYKDDIRCHVYGTGLAVEIPEGYVGLLFPRSSNRKTESYLTNHVGVIDSGYRGEVMLSFKTRDYNENQIQQLNKPYEVGDKIGQLIIMPYPKVKFVEVDELSISDRGENGHGSSGR